MKSGYEYRRTGAKRAKSFNLKQKKKGLARTTYDLTQDDRDVIMKHKIKHGFKNRNEALSDIINIYSQLVKSLNN